MHDHRGPALGLALSPSSLCSVGVGQRTRQRVSGADLPVHTPRTPDCGSPVPLTFSTAGNRKSSDSWNSLESADYEPDTEWKTDHLNFLLRTVEGLRASNLTPYNGVPPANLLDKVALNIVNAKDSWPHTARQTRLKLLELCRSSWREKLQSERRGSVIREETGSDIENDPNVATSVRRKPLHRQSSMDFMSSAKLGSKAADGFGRLSRLQNACPTTPKTERRTSNLNPRTPSSTTLNSSVSASSGPRLVRKASTMTVSSTDSYNGPCLLDPRVQRIRRSDSFGSLRVVESHSAQGTPATPAVRRTLKRAPSYGSSRSAGSTKFDMDTEEDVLEPVRSILQGKSKSKNRPRKDSTSSQTSDEEEKTRGKKTKKARRRSPSPPPPPSSLPCSPDASIPFPSPAPMPVASSSRRRPRICPKRNPSMFGPELTGLGGLGPHSPISACPSSFPALLSAATVVNAAAEAEAREAEADLRRPRTLLVSPVTPDMTSPRRLRRMKGSDRIATRPSALGPAALARRISFNSLRQPEAAPVPSQIESVPSALGGAFELI